MNNDSKEKLNLCIGEINAVLVKHGFYIQFRPWEMLLFRDRNKAKGKQLDLSIDVLNRSLLNEEFTEW